ncbi:aminoacyl-tRNA deacylase [Glycomyces artemisiae]|uniref:Prolyl-tRNA editing enzyme YbaK/EbsC (Cys-tRNA(Pro) deacylase) n=1 Tax=Glycomyces artemisiae TaxID=1076443 RepID=A0A2T0UPT6_9ACTN|nr:YbaK/EbsC family protein [Glycomyces artemisiae]PRY59933.1 prolyl-tRNA editing enzyme YbaK/EbsC (Cys-tRNA(Pro) deacylase) [Glycomyces artemisiae]
MEHPAQDRTAPESTERAAADAAARGLAVEFVPRDPETGAPLARELMGVKTIVLRSRDGYVFVLVPYEDRFSWPKLRSVLGVNKLKLPTADEAFAATGYRRGTITPLGAVEAFPVLADERLLGREIVIGSGSPDFAARVGADDLIRAYGAEVVDLAPE